MRGIEGRVVLVTGAARGIGAATVRRLADAGHRVVAVDACQGDTADVPYALATREDLHDLVSSYDESVVGHVADVRDRAALQAGVDVALERWGRLDAVVAAAAVIAGGTPQWETPDAQLDLLWDVDAKGVWTTAAVTIPALLANPDPTGGRFVAVASAAGTHGLFGLSAYNMAKHAVVGLVKGLAADLAGTGVTACAVSPGSTRTPMLQATADLYDLPAQTGVEEFSANQLLRRSHRSRRDRRDRRVLLQPRRRGPERIGRARRRRLLGVTTAVAARDLPTGFRVRLRADLIRADRGRLIVGGSPARAVRLSERAQELLADDTLTVIDAATARLARRLLDGNLAAPDLDDLDDCGDTGDMGVLAEDVTVVVPVRDRATQLARCLAALSPLQVIVVDDASEDPATVAEVVHEYGARLVPLSTNVGPAGARNAGLAHVTTPLVAFVDSDVIVGARELIRLARHCADPRVALVGPRVAGRVVGQSRSRRPRWFERYEVAASSLDLGRTGSQVAPGAEVAWLPSACLIGRVAHLTGDIGGFEDTWRVAEDVDLVWRLIDAGHVVRYDPSVEAHHDIRPSVRTWLGRKFVYGTGGADLAARHGDKVAPAVLSLPMALGAAALLQRRWWSAPVAAAAVASTARSLAPHLPAEEGSARIAVRLATRGLGWAVRQESGLLLRHWWPAAALAAPFSRTLRRALVTAVLVDMVVFLAERPGVDPLTALIARRLDDMAYGSGLWWGAIKRRSPRVLAVRWIRRDARTPGSPSLGRR